MDGLLGEFPRIYQGRVHTEVGCSGEHSVRTEGGISNSLQRLSAPNKLHLDLYAGVLVLLALVKCLHL